MCVIADACQLDLLRVRQIPVKEDPSFSVRESSEELPGLIEEMRKIALLDRDGYDKVCLGFMIYGVCVDGFDREQRHSCRLPRHIPNTRHRMSSV